jgi:hypothetical protein
VGFTEWYLVGKILDFYFFYLFLILNFPLIALKFFTKKITFPSMIFAKCSNGIYAHFAQKNRRELEPIESRVIKFVQNRTISVWKGLKPRVGAGSCG